MRTIGSHFDAHSASNSHPPFFPKAQTTPLILIVDASVIVED